MLAQAEELLKSAKKTGSSDPRAQDFFAPTYLDYHFNSYYNQIKVTDSRQNHLSLREGDNIIRLYQKPYALEKFKILLNDARFLVTTGIPRSRLKRFGNSPTLGKLNGTLEFLKLYVRTRNTEHKRAIWDTLSHFGCAQPLIPWRQDKKDEISTMIMDLVELTEFIP